MTAPPARSRSRGMPIRRSLEREALLIRLLDEFAAQSRAGTTPDFDSVGRSHPEIVDELRELWATAMVAEDLATLSHVLDGAAAKPEGPPVGQATRRTR